MAEQFVQTKIKGDKVVLFIKPTCPYCTMAKGVLSKYKIKSECLEVIDISGLSDVGRVQDYLEKLTGARTVPRVFIGEKCVGGGSDVKELHENGQLEVMLQTLGALQ